MAKSKNQSENFKVSNISLAAEGRKKIEWAESRMPVLMALREKYKTTKPLKGFRIAGCLHVTKETAVLIETLIAAGAQVSWSGCNPLSTNDEVAAALAENGVSIYAWHGMNVKEFYWAIERTLDFKPNLIKSPYLIKYINRPSIIRWIGNIQGYYMNCFIHFPFFETIEQALRAQYPNSGRQVLEGYSLSIFLIEPNL